MGKWLGGIVTALILLALSSLLGAALKRPIDDWASSERLRAEIQLAPWIEKPQSASNGQVKSKPDLVSIYQSISPSLDDFGVAKIIVSNEGKSVVTNVNFRMDSPYHRQDIAVLSPDADIKFFNNSGRVKLPDLNPGDKITVYMWNDMYSSHLFPRAFKSYSSEGSFRTTYDWPTNQQRTYDSGISKFLDDYAGWVAGISLSILFVLMVGVAAYNEAYYKFILKNREFYEEEKVKFDEDPKKFKPNYTKIKLE